MIILLVPVALDEVVQKQKAFAAFLLATFLTGP